MLAPIAEEDSPVAAPLAPPAPSFSSEYLGIDEMQVRVRRVLVGGSTRASMRPQAVARHPSCLSLAAMVCLLHFPLSFVPHLGGSVVTLCVLLLALHCSLRSVRIRVCAWFSCQAGDSNSDYSSDEDGVDETCEAPSGEVAEEERAVIAASFRGAGPAAPSARNHFLESLPVGLPTATTPGFEWLAAFPAAAPRPAVAPPIALRPRATPSRSPAEARAGTITHTQAPCGDGPAV